MSTEESAVLDIDVGGGRTRLPPGSPLYAFEAGGKRYASVGEAFRNAGSDQVFVIALDVGTRARVLHP